MGNRSSMKEKIKESFKGIDLIIVITMTLLICIGLFCERQAFMLSEEQNSIFIKHLAGVILGYVMIAVILLVDYHFICRLSFLLYLFMIAVLGYTLVAGNNLNNVKRWVMILGIPFQPSELTKVVLILFLGFLCNHFKDKLNRFYVLVILAVVAAIPVGLILLEPHLSSSLAILFIFGIIVYSSGITYKVIGTALAMILPVIAVIFISVAVFKVDIPFIEEYQIKRVLSFLSTDESDALSGDYQQNQSIAAIGSGGLHGKTISLESDQTRTTRAYQNIYAKESDFVFAIVGEEFGFLGSFVIILLYALLIFRCILISTRTSEYMGRIICMGVSSYLIFQIFVNIGVATKLLPNTGLTLPFISYGLTSLISSMIAVGLVINVGVGRSYKGKRK